MPLHATESLSRSTSLVEVCLCVDVRDRDDVAFWATLFEASSPEIEYAVRNVGADAGAVERFIRFTRLDGAAAFAARPSSRTISARRTRMRRRPTGPVRLRA